MSNPNYHHEGWGHEEGGNLWFPYDYGPNVALQAANAQQQLQLLQLQQQQQQGQQPGQPLQQLPPSHHHHHHQQLPPPFQLNTQLQLNQNQINPPPAMFNQIHQHAPPPHLGGLAAPNQQQHQQQQHQLHQQLQMNQQHLQQHVQQLQQPTNAAAVVVPNPVNDPAELVAGVATAANNGNAGDAELDAVAAAAVSVRGQKRRPSTMDNEEDDEDEDEEDEDEEDDDDDEEEEDLPPPPPRKRTKKDGEVDYGEPPSTKHPKKISRRQRPPKTSITRTRYSNDFKMRVVSELEEPGYGTITDISKHYRVAEQTLRDWMKNKNKIIDAVQRRGNMKANPINHLKHVTQALLQFMDDHYSAAGPLGDEQPVTARVIAAKGNEIKQQLLDQDARQPFLTENERKMTHKFSASLSWGKKWVRQYARPKTTQVPQDLEQLSKEELVRLLRSVASEREQLEQSQIAPRQGGPTNGTANRVSDNGRNRHNAGGNGGIDLASLLNGAPPKPIYVKPSSLLPLIPSPPRVKVTYNIDQAKARISEMLTALIKKKAHNWKGRPTTELTEAVPTLDAARELMKGYTETNKTARSYRWQLTGAEVVQWLKCPKYVHPIKFEGKVVCTIGQPAYVYAFAGYDSMLVKYEQSSAMLTIRLKTFTAGTGNIPGSDEPVFLTTDN
jgi:hypothetical protein